MNILKTAFSFLILFSLFSCANDSQEELALQVERDENQLITYNLDVAPLLARRCFQCHDDPTANGAPSRSAWVNFSVVRANAAAINGRIANGTMPPSGGLPQAERDLIAQWIEDGMLEN